MNQHTVTVQQSGFCALGRIPSAQERCDHACVGESGKALIMQQPLQDEGIPGSKTGT